MTQIPKSRVPGPWSIPYVGLLPSFVRDPLALLENISNRYGAKAWLPLGKVRFLLLTDPEFAHEVLVKQNRKLVKSRGLTAGRRIFGNGLFTSEGELWQKQRQAIQAAFRDLDGKACYETVARTSLEHALSWGACKTIEVTYDLKQLSLDILLASIFGLSKSEYDPAMWSAIDVIIKHIDRRIRSKFHFPDHWPIPANKRFERAACILEQSVFRLIDKGKLTNSDKTSMLGAILRESSANCPMSDQQVRDEVLTLFIAGHEATANAMAWALYCIASRADVERSAVAELQSVLGHALPCQESTCRLKYIRAIILESLRLYPPSWALVRRATEPICVDSDWFPVGTEVIISQWVIHRSPKLYDFPNEFRPERWLVEQPVQQVPLSFFPFGAGPRQCPGRDFAIESMVVMLAVLLQNGSFELVTQGMPVPEVKLTLRPRPPLMMHVRRRN
jgi:cytochrome P450